MTKATIEPVSRVKAHTRYHVDGKRVPSVTTILGVINKPALIPWANRMGRQGIDTRTYVDKLAEVGTLAHYWIECMLTGREPDFHSWSQEQVDLATPSIEKFRQWHGEHDVRVLGTEMPLVSKRHRYGGTIDVLAEIDGQVGLVDIKTSKAIYDDHVHQVAAYHELAQENGHTPKSVRILQVGRNPEERFSVRCADNREIALHFEVFRSALSLYRAKQAAGRKR